MTALVILEPRTRVSPSSASDFVQQPKQDRSRRTLERIARAALELIAEQGVEATTVAQIVHRADSSVGSFYARFSGKDELVHYVEERVWSEAQRRWDEALASNAWEGLTLEAVAEGLIRLFIQVERVAGKSRRALAFQGSSASGELTPAQRFRRHLDSGVRTLLLSRGERIRHPRPSEAVILGYRTVSAAIQDLLAEPPRLDVASDADATHLDDDSLCAELTTLLLSYLGATPAPGEQPGEVDFFEIWG